MNTGANNMLSASFPFSWLIYEAVEQFLLVTSENAIGICKLLYILQFTNETSNIYTILYSYSFVPDEIHCSCDIIILLTYLSSCA